MRFATYKAMQYVLNMRQLGIEPTKEGYLNTIKLWKDVK